ncbi:MAG: antibiotic biosynthesis monooxygenase [Acidobacteria bacterium]|nr:antibiotic biosynthesis monooxygenase [Acidobacteriota bacterium]
MFTVIYRWKVKAGCEEQFRDAWRRATEAIYQTHQSLGSRLHRCDDGRWLAYAQWPDRRHWEAMQNRAAPDAEAFALMRDSTQGAAEVICMEISDDLFKCSA